MRVRLLAAVAGVVSLLGVFLASPATAAPASSGYYVSLGDSLAFGYEPDLVAAGDLDADSYRGFPEYFAAMRPHLTLVNFACSGETTRTMLVGGCPWPGTLHDSWGGAPSQAAAALAFLAANAAETSLISIAIGSNDLLALVGTCQRQVACIATGLPAVLQQMAANYGALLTQIRALAPDVPIVLFNLFNPLAAQLPGSDQLLAPVNGVISQLAAAFGASVADAFGAVNGTAGGAAEDTLICVRTWMCSEFTNIHPNDVGYRAMAVALLQAL